MITGPFGSDDAPEAVDAPESDDAPEAVDAPESVDETDGRRLRRDRNRDAVVDSLLAIYGEGNLDPSSTEIAERAGLSPRSLFRYFDDIDDLARAAIGLQVQRVQHLFVVSAEAHRPLHERVAALVEQRIALFDAIEPAARVVRVRAPFQSVLADELAHTRGLLRGQVRHVLAPELDAMDPDRAAKTLSGADVLCSFESHQLMRHSQGLERPLLDATLAANLEALVTANIHRAEGAPA